jgi:hypothetical protein
MLLGVGVMAAWRFVNESPTTVRRILQELVLKHHLWVLEFTVVHNSPRVSVSHRLVSHRGKGLQKILC